MTRVKSSAAMPFVIFFQVRPWLDVLKRYGRKSSCLYRLAATYAVPASWGEASMIDTNVQDPSPGGVTFFQVLPSSRETCTSPSSLPAQRTPRWTGDSAKAKTVQ